MLLEASWGHHSSRDLSRGAPLSGWVSNDTHRGLGNSFGENDQNSNCYSVHYILSLKKSFFPLYLVKHVYFLKI